jgi:hypothetical protein
MGYCVYPAFQGFGELFGEHRDLLGVIEKLIEQLHEADPKQCGERLPGLQPIGRGWYKKRCGNYRLIAKLIRVKVDNFQVPVVVFVAFLNRDDPAHGNGTADEFESRYAERLEGHGNDIHQAAREWLQQQQDAAAWQPPPKPPDDLLPVLDPVRPRGRVDAFYLHANFCRAYERLTLDTEKASVYRAMVEIENREHWEPYDQLLDLQDGRVVLSYVRLQEPRAGFKHVLVLGLVSETWDLATRQNESQRISQIWQAVQQRILALPPDTPADHYHDAICQFAERAFPTYILADEQLWQRLWRRA